MRLRVLNCILVILLVMIPLLSSASPPVAAQAALPDLVIAIIPDGSAYKIIVRNDGSADATAVIRYELRSDRNISGQYGGAVLDGADKRFQLVCPTIVGQGRPEPILGFACSGSGVIPARSGDVAVVRIVPPTQAPYTITASIDPANAVQESIEGNNTASVGSTPPTSELPRQSCEQEASLRSVEGVTSTGIRFINRSTQTVKTYWLGYDGKRVFYNDVPPGTAYLQQTFVTHPWVVADSGNRCLAVFQPSGALADAVISQLPEADAVAPTTVASVSPTPNSAGWNDGPTVVTLSAADNPGGAGVKEIVYSATGSETIAETVIASTSTRVEVANRGVTTLTYGARDAAGNRESLKTLKVTISNPRPRITSLTPSSATVRRGAFTLTVDGAGFVSGSTVRWNNEDRSTTFVSSTRLTARILEADVAEAGVASVTVFTPGPGGGLASFQRYTISQLPPAVLRQASPPASSIGPANRAVIPCQLLSVPTSPCVPAGAERPVTYVASDARVKLGIAPSLLCVENENPLGFAHYGVILEGWSYVDARGTRFDGWYKDVDGTLVVGPYTVARQIDFDFDCLD